MQLLHMDKVRRRGALLFVAALGGAAGFGVTARSVDACSCAQPEWRVVLQSATSSDPNVSHEEFWPAEATLNAYPGYAGLRATSSETGIVHYLGAGQ
jgi:hypothetical protein